MIPILYEPNETDFTSNGLGRLRSCTRAEVVEERNGVYELEFDYPVTGAHYSEITEGRIVAVEHDETGKVEPFDIYGHSAPINGIVTFKAQHISYRLRGSVAKGTNITTLLGAFSMLQSAVPNMGFSYDTDYESEGYMAAADGIPRSVREFLGGVEGSILDTYGGEYEFTRFQVNLWKNRGKTRDFVIRYGVNLMDYDEDVDFSEAFTAIVPYWSKDDEIVVGDMVTSMSASYNGRETCVAMDCYDKFETKPTKANLESYAQNYLLDNQPSFPSRNIRVDFVRLQDSDEFHMFSNLQKCSLCDSIKVIFPMYGMEGYFKIVKVVWDVLLERYTEMELGNLSTTLSEALGLSGNLSGGSEGSAVGTPGRVIETGNITGSSISAGSYGDYSVNFTKAFHDAPIVVACFQSTSTAGAFGKCTLGVVSTTSAGFTVRVFNGDSSGRGPNINWIAIGS